MKKQSQLISFVLIVLVIVSANARVCAQTVTIYSLNDCGSSYPDILAQGRSGDLYSTAFGCDSGEPDTLGGVFEISPNGVMNVIYDFNSVSGTSVNSGLTLGTDGDFYGAATEGGAHNFGTIFKVTSGGSLTTLYSFTNGIDGAAPYGPPIQGADGNFYGTTSAGTAYKITSSGVFTSLGAIPGPSYAPLLLGADGYLYGTTYTGGKGGLGTVFRMSSRGDVAVIYSFDRTHGAGPLAALIQANDGSFYGTASFGGNPGGGVVFRLTPVGAITVLHNFDPDNMFDGYMPTAALVQATDGNFYGTAVEGGVQQRGLIFELTSAGAYSAIYYFNGFQNEAYGSPMQHTNGEIYGTLNSGYMYSLDVGIAPFIKTLPGAGRVGKTLGILGTGLTGATSVEFNGEGASFSVLSDTYVSTSVPAGATTGFVTVTTPNGILKSNQQFRVTPQILSFSPTSGPVGATVVIAGDSLTGATEVIFACGKKATFTVDSDTQITATVPTGAMTGVIGVETQGGNAGSPTAFTVTP